jgi:hexosaminidase
MEREIVSIIPQPWSTEKNEGNFTLSCDSKISANVHGCEAAELLAYYLRPATGYALPVTNIADTAIRINVGGNGQADDAGFTDESYEMKIDIEGVNISAPARAGAVRGIQTLRQLFPPAIFSDKRMENHKWTVPCLHINDKPALRWRGMHLDVSRHFFNVEEVERFIDLLALHKFNILHLHLTDDQGWRIEIKQYPGLTAIGARRECSLTGHDSDRPRKYDDQPYGGFYTQDDIRRLVDFAAARQITIVPEIDMPGHMQAAISAYPELGNTDISLKPRCHWGISQHILNARDSTVEFMKNVLDEIMEMFPSRFIHIGGDEALKHEWSESREIQDRIRALGLKNEHDLQRWFIGQMNSHLQQKGRRLIGWDEIIEGGIVAGVAVMNWQVNNVGAEAANAGHDVVVAQHSHLYFNFYQSEPTAEEPPAIGGMTSLGKVYSFNPFLDGVAEDKKHHIIGAQGQLWTEYISSMKQLEYMAFPRVCALGEILWSAGGKKSFRDFLLRLDYHRQRLACLNVNAHRQAAV